MFINRGEKYEGKFTKGFVRMWNLISESDNMQKESSTEKRSLDLKIKL